MVVSLISGKVKKRHYWHLAFPGVYLFLQRPFLMLPEDAKYNAWVAAYHPEWPWRVFTYPYDPQIFFLTDHHTELSLLSLLLYGLLGVIKVVRTFRERKESFFRTTHPVLRRLRQGSFSIASALILFFTIKWFNQKDLGDHILATYFALTIYLTSFSVMRSSGFFTSPSLGEQTKYKSSSLTVAQREETLSRIQIIMRTEKPFFKLTYSLPDLARQLNISIHTLSQSINEGIGKSFF
jgi:hypothetical protein